MGSLLKLFHSTVFLLKRDVFRHLPSLAELINLKLRYHPETSRDEFLGQKLESERGSAIGHY